ncbi:DNA/RNA polymerase [Suhomyces tanzawaensis NRRL Y-17324]|uniref:DNA-directed RNA polymerase n=1 Tax=Suhomyces tanzawaensis NRRL Y-17324 TaxID=984487 RepID=A0A1E4SS00_9ASCO|nr:DNA/RNA polymerase [Suhomyces tanzawaensis NRRL Y-17324]ODV82275.1 DNA/RNA polymerase [Suhomyces tanzawaensis NRRL Y-17324]
MFRYHLSRHKAIVHGQKKDEGPFVAVPENHLAVDKLIPGETHEFPKDSISNKEIINDENTLGKRGSKRRLSLTRMKQAFRRKCSKLKADSLRRWKAIFSKSKDSDINLQESSPLSSQFSNERGIASTNTSVAPAKSSMSILENIPVSDTSKGNRSNESSESIHIVDISSFFSFDLGPEINPPAETSSLFSFDLGPEVVQVANVSDRFPRLVPNAQAAVTSESATKRSETDLKRIRSELVILQKDYKEEFGCLGLIVKSDDPYFLFFEEQIWELELQIRAIDSEIYEGKDLPDTLYDDQKVARNQPEQIEEGGPSVAVPSKTYEELATYHDWEEWWFDNCFSKRSMSELIKLREIWAEKLEILKQHGYEDTPFSRSLNERKLALDFLIVEIKSKLVRRKKAWELGDKQIVHTLDKNTINRHYARLSPFRSITSSSTSHIHTTWFSNTIYSRRVRYTSTSSPQENPSSLLNRATQVLDISPLSLHRESNPSRSVGATTSIRINQFFQSIIVNDFNRSRDILNKLGQHINVQYYKASSSSLVLEQIDNYYSCFLILLTSQKCCIQDIKLLTDDFRAIDRGLSKLQTSSGISENKREIQNMLIVKLVQCFQEFTEVKKTNERIMKASIAKFIKLLMKEFQVKPEIIINHKDINYQAFEEICKMVKIKTLPSSPHTVEPLHHFHDSSIDSFKDSNGFISLTGLCSYICSKRFDIYGPGKMYQIYDTLTSQEQLEFMQKYQAFCHAKQLNVESYCLDLVEDIDAHKKPEDASIHKFRSENSEFLYEWFTASVAEINTLAKKLLNHPDLQSLSEDERVLAKYFVHWNLIPKNALITLILSKLLTATLASPQEYVRLAELVKQISASFKRLVYKEPSYKLIRNEVLKRFDEDEDGIILFTSLLKIVMNKCKLKLLAKDRNVMKEVLLLGGQSQYLQPDQDDNAFKYSLIRLERTKLLGVITIHPYLFQKLKTYDSLTFNRSLYLPMLCTPKPWVSPTDGGYLKDLKPIVTSNDINSCLAYLNKAHQTGQLSSLYEGLNTLSLNAWAINSKVLEIYNDAMESEMGFLKIPAKIAALSEEQDDYHDLKGLRIQYNMIQLIANSFDENGDMFYLPHGVDFRGRAYPMVSELSHYQQDSVRGLMMFWHSKPLGTNGFDWIKYQLVGVSGQDKLTMEQRLVYFDQHLDLILDSARNPLDGKMWWKSAEKPWQTLALCIEVDNIVQYGKTGKIEDYRSRIPIHQDGSCNGLQHYAALGADREGGLSVNLLPLADNRRGDVYAKVLEIVERKVASDAKSGTEIARVASLILSRKLIKQTVMTTVYGVTNYGGAAQIEQRIKELVEDITIRSEGIQDTSIFVDNQRRLAIYLSGIVLDSVSELFAGAKLIQDWLLENCYRIINSFDLETVEHFLGEDTDFMGSNSYKPMMWTSLSGFPVVQLYKHTKFSLIPTTLQSVKINRPTEIAPINKKKQLNAIAPNFIHSLDSIHMFMTAVSSRLHSIGFVSVHDSFWTYPCDVEVLSKILREEFVRLHSSDIIENLRADMLYTTKMSFQLVWIENINNKELISAILEYRSKHTSKSMAYILRQELQELTEGSSRIAHLIKEYEPQLFIKSKSGRSLESYTSRINLDRRVRKYETKKFTPVLVPVQILECPPRGDLDIKEVLASRYFFS